MIFHRSWFTVFEFLLLVIFILVAFLVIKYYYKRRKVFQLAAKIPGPKPWPIIGSALDFADSDLDILAKLRNYKENRQLFSLWLGHHLFVCIYTPDFAEAFCQSPKLLDRSERAKFTKPLAQNGLILASGAQWRKAKKLMESALPYSNLKTFIPIFEREGKVLIKRLESEVGKPCFSLHDYFTKCAFDIISEITVELEEKAQNFETTLQEDVDLFLELSCKRVVRIWQQWDFLYKLFPEGKEFYRIVDSVTRKANDILSDKKEEYEEEKTKLKCEEELQKTKKKKFWQVLLDDESLSLEEMRDHIFSVVVAGYETSSNATCFALVMLALHPDVQEKAYQEVVSVIDGDFDEENIHKLEYLEMIVKETLRLFPTAPIIIRNAAEDVQIGKYLIPAGTDVSLNVYELHRDPNQYDNPSNFNPDNFLPENVAKRHKYSYLPFSGGLRKCIGKLEFAGACQQKAGIENVLDNRNYRYNVIYLRVPRGGKFAMFEMKVLISMMLLHYKFECDYRTIEDVKVRTFITLGMPDGFQVRILKR